MNEEASEPVDRLHDVALRICIDETQPAASSYRAKTCGRMEDVAAGVTTPARPST